MASCSRSAQCQLHTQQLDDASLCQLVSAQSQTSCISPMSLQGDKAGAGRCLSGAGPAGAKAGGGTLGAASVGQGQREASCRARRSTAGVFGSLQCMWPNMIRHAGHSVRPATQAGSCAQSWLQLSRCAWHLVSHAMDLKEALWAQHPSDKAGKKLRADLAAAQQVRLA